MMIISIIIAVLCLYKEKIANTFVSAILNSNGGPDRIRTNDQAVAVPCLTTWLRVHLLSDVIIISKHCFYVKHYFVTF